ncbi:M14 family metallopeptidase [Merdibacter massiliensis]|uniref:M14 family metallopeptidase n=1 Tax=Merdibacter massiliensis TaxID=1871030 RepID=UPI00096AAF34|nr:M14 family metallopeptidase [Merdibacter massiliensis]
MKTTFQYDHYYDYAELTACLQTLQETYPTIMKLESICVSEEGKNVWAVTLTDKTTGDAMDKPAYYMDGNHHAGEVTGSMACMHFIDAILTNHAEPSMAKLLAETTIYVIPKISPDGSDEYLHTANKLRSVNRPYPKAALDDGLHAQDINEDGIIAMMRVKTPFGAWKKRDGDDFVMTKRLPDDQEGEFYNIYTEGTIVNFDGVNIKIGTEKWGLDFNRNYPFGWFIEARQPGAGKYPLSNPENKAVADFVIAHKNIGSVLTMHTTGGVLVYPPGTMPSKEASQEDMRMYKEIGVMATQEMHYPVVNIFDNFLQDTVNYSSGAFDDWCYHTQGIPAYTVELWNVKERAGCPQQWPIERDKSDAKKEEEFFKVTAWVKEHCPSGILPWTHCTHPQLGDVEIGGIDFKFTCQNCPPDYLLQEMEKTTAFALRHAKVLPKLIIDDVKVTQQSEDIFQIDAVIANKGYLPTYICEEAKKAQVNQPLEISLKNAEILTQSSTVEELAGFFNINTEYGYDGIETGNNAPLMKKITWIVKGKKGQTVLLQVQSEKAGKVQKEIILK